MMSLGRMSLAVISSSQITSGLLPDACISRAFAVHIRCCSMRSGMIRPWRGDCCCLVNRCDSISHVAHDRLIPLTSGFLRASISFVRPSAPRVRRMFCTQASIFGIWRRQWVCPVMRNNASWAAICSSSVGTWPVRCCNSSFVSNGGLSPSLLCSSLFSNSLFSKDPRSAVVGSTVVGSADHGSTDPGWPGVGPLRYSQLFVRSSTGNGSSIAS